MAGSPVGYPAEPADDSGPVQVDARAGQPEGDLTVKRILIAVVVVCLAVVLSVAACNSSSGSGLSGKAWQWTSGTDPGTPMPGVVPNPANYTATFNTDGTIAVKADCNNSTGTYRTSGSDLTIILGPTTLAACPPGSLSSVFLAGLPTAKSYTIANNALTITLHDGRTMQFQ
jgi:heat shock protein HslJ